MTVNPEFRYKILEPVICTLMWPVLSLTLFYLLGHVTDIYFNDNPWVNNNLEVSLGLLTLGLILCMFSPVYPYTFYLNRAKRISALNKFEEERDSFYILRYYVEFTLLLHPIKRYKLAINKPRQAELILADMEKHRLLMHGEQKSTSTPDIEVFEKVFPPTVGIRFNPDLNRYESKTGFVTYDDYAAERQTGKWEAWKELQKENLLNKIEDIYNHGYQQGYNKCLKILENQ